MPIFGDFYLEVNKRRSTPQPQPYLDLFEREARISGALIDALAAGDRGIHSIRSLVSFVHGREFGQWNLRGDDARAPDSVIESIIWTLVDRGILRSTMDGRVGLALEK